MLDLLFTSEDSQRKAVRQMRMHNDMAFTEAQQILQKKKDQEFINEWRKEFGEDPKYLMSQIVPMNEIMSYIKKHYGYAQLAKDGWFGVKVVYERD